MTRYFYLCFFLVLPFITLGQKSSTYKIHGLVDSIPDETKVYLYMYPEYIDSTVIKNKAFRFNGKIDEPMLAAVVLESLENMENRKKAKRFWLEGTHIKIKGSGNSFTKAHIEGSAASKDYETYDNYIRNELSKRGLYDDKGKLKYFSGFNKLKDSLTINFIESHPSSYHSGCELYFARQSIPFEKVKNLYHSFPAHVKANYFGKLIAEFISNYTKLKIGDIAPDFSLPGMDGKPVSLSSFRGKYLLISFWGSWCAPCRSENIRLNAIYEKYKERGLEILGVGLDTKDALAKAIEKDNIKFPNIFEEREYHSPIMFKYGVWAVPATVLLDPSGKIIGIDMMGYEQRFDYNFEKVLKNKYCL